MVMHHGDNKLTERRRLMNKVDSLGANWTGSFGPFISQYEMDLSYSVAIDNFNRPSELDGKGWNKGSVAIKTNSLIRRVVLFTNWLTPQPKDGYRKYISDYH